MMDFCCSTSAWHILKFEDDPRILQVEEPLRSRLRLTSRQRRVRFWVERGVDEAALRSLVEDHVPQLRALDWAMEEESTTGDVAEAVRRLFEEDDKEEEEEEEKKKKVLIRIVATAPLPEEEAAGRKKVVEASAYQMVSWYTFFKRPLESEEEVERTCKALEASWARFGVVGRAYVAREGVNAQLAVPAETFGAYAAAHETQFRNWILEGRSTAASAAPLNPDTRLSRAEFDATKPFRALHVRPRDQIVADGSAPDEALDLENAGYEASPEEWHEALGGDYGATMMMMKKKKKKKKEKKTAGGAEAKKPPRVLLDCRNHYETEIGTFAGSTPLETETFKETYARLDEMLEDVPRDENVHMFCTGGIRCVKVGAYVRQVLGFQNVTRLRGGIVNYTQHLEKDRLEGASQFRGVNYVFDERMGEAITSDEVYLRGGTSLDPRAAEAVARAKKKAVDHEKKEEEEDNALEGYAERLSDREPALMARVRLDAAARWPRTAHMVSGPTQGRLLGLLCQLGRARRVLEIGTFAGYGTLWFAHALKGSDSDKCEVVTVEKDPAAAAVARAHFAAARADHPNWAPIRLIEADWAVLFDDDDNDDDGDNLDRHQEPFDVVYVDADKKGYAAVFDAVMDRKLVKPGGLVIADNTLWKGRVLGVESAGAPASDEDEARRLDDTVRAARADAKERGLDEDAAAKEAKVAAKADRRDRALQQAMHEFNVKLRKDPRVENLVLPLRDGLTIARVLDY